MWYNKKKKTKIFSISSIPEILYNEVSLGSYANLGLKDKIIFFLHLGQICIILSMLAYAHCAVYFDKDF